MIQAVYCSKELLDKLEEKEYPVHSSFAHGFNLLIEDRLCFIGNKNFALTPYGILLKKSDIVDLAQKVKLKDMIFRWCKKEQYFISVNQEEEHFIRENQEKEEQIIISCKYTLIFSSFLEKNEKFSSTSAIELIQREVDINWMTGFGKSIRDLKYGKDNKISKFLDFMKYSDLMNQRTDFYERISVKKSLQMIEADENKDEILYSLIGYGNGLTPAGDDFILGILFVRKMIEINGENKFSTSSSVSSPLQISEITRLNCDSFSNRSEFLKIKHDCTQWEDSLYKILSRKVTTDVSLHQYRCAFENLFHEDILLLYQGICEKNQKLIKTSIEKIVQIGHTSGKDFLAGMIITMKYFDSI